MLQSTRFKGKDALLIANLYADTKAKVSTNSKEDVSKKPMQPHHAWTALPYSLVTKKPILTFTLDQTESMSILRALWGGGVCHLNSS